MAVHELYLDKESLSRIAEGDEQAFTILVRSVGPSLEPAVFKWVQDEEAVKEVLQETFLRVWLHRDQLPQLEQPVHWIFRVASNECFTWLNKQALRRRKLREWQQQSSSGATGDPLHALDGKETERLILQAVEHLPEQKRLIYRMSREQGLKTSEIADQLQLSHGHVRNSLSSSLQFIREYLKAAGKIIALVAAFLK